jgi:polyhydroxyalkanoate synthesis regulator phasin
MRSAVIAPAKLIGGDTGGTPKPQGGASMMDVFKKTLYSAVGMAYLTKERVEELGRKFAKDVDMSEEEGKRFMEELMKSSEEARSSLNKTVGEIVENTLKRLDVPTGKDMHELSRRVDNLEARLEKND